MALRRVDGTRVFPEYEMQNSCKLRCLLLKGFPANELQVKLVCISVFQKNASGESALCRGFTWENGYCPTICRADPFSAFVPGELFTKTAEDNVYFGGVCS